MLDLDPMTLRWREIKVGTSTRIEVAGMVVPQSSIPGRCFCGQPAFCTGGGNLCERHQGATFLFMPDILWFLSCPVERGL